MARRDSVSRLIWCLALWLGGETVADASSFYTVTDLGPNWSSDPIAGANGQTYLQNWATNATIPFPVSTIPVNDSPIDTSKIPPESGYIGATNPQLTTFPVQVLSSNLLGNFIGGFPDSGGRADPTALDNLDIDYFAKQPDGSYKETFLGPPGFFSGSIPKLNAMDQILAPGGLWNLDTNTILNVNQIVAPEILSRYKFGLGLLALADDGSILAATYSTDYGGPLTYVLLTPPGMPMPTPEPSTLVVLAIGLGGLAVRRHRNPAGFAQG